MCPAEETRFCGEVISEHTATTGAPEVTQGKQFLVSWTEEDLRVSQQGCKTERSEHWKTQVSTLLIHVKYLTQ